MPWRRKRKPTPGFCPVHRRAWRAAVRGVAKSPQDWGTRAVTSTCSLTPAGPRTRQDSAVFHVYDVLSHTGCRGRLGSLQAPAAEWGSFLDESRASQTRGRLWSGVKSLPKAHQQPATDHTTALPAPQKRSWTPRVLLWKLLRLRLIWLFFKYYGSQTKHVSGIWPGGHWSATLLSSFPCCQASPRVFQASNLNPQVCDQTGKSLPITHNSSLPFLYFRGGFPIVYFIF